MCNKIVLQKCQTCSGPIIKGKYPKKGNNCSRKCSAIYRWSLIYDIYHDFLQNKIKQNTILDEKGCWNWQKSKSKSGYPKITYRNKTLRGNRVSYLVFKGDIKDGLLVCHTCDNPACLNPDHLYLGDSQTNCDDKAKRERQARGEKISISKLTGAQVLEIRKMHEVGYSQGQIAKLFDVYQTTISGIVRRRTWKHI